MSTILLSTDFSTHALNACAFDLFGVGGNTFLLVHTYVDVLPGYDALVDMTSVQYAAGVEGMAGFMERIRGTERVKDAVLVSTVVAGPLVSALGELCRSRAVDAIAMGTHGATGLALIGSNASAVVRGSRVPVLVVPRDARYAGLRTLLIADDQRPKDAGGMALVTRLAQREHARIAMAHVLGPDSGEAGPGVSRSAEELFPGSEVTHVEASGTDVARTISNLAERIQADLVVVQHRHLGLLQGLFYTSTAAQLALHTRIPLLVLEA